MKKKFYKAQLGILNYGIRIDSGSVGNSSEFFSALNTDVQTPSDNIAMKLTNTNPKKSLLLEDLSAMYVL